MKEEVRGQSFEQVAWKRCVMDSQQLAHSDDSPHHDTGLVLSADLLISFKLPLIKEETS